MQYRITSADINQTSEDDCVLSPDDPIHSMKGVSQLGGLGSMETLAAYASAQAPKVQGSNKGQIQRELNIKPGTDEWFKLWYGDAR
jgi:hypothetical protein